MKNIYLFIILLTTIISACEMIGQDNLNNPNVSIDVSPSNPKVGDTVTVTLSTDAEYLTIFTGDAMHEYEKSRIKAIMENNWDSFYDTVYRVPLAPKGYNCTWKRYMKDYKTLDDVSKDFTFFGAISNIELGVYGDDFPEALYNVKYPDQNQLKFTVTDRRIPSGFIFHPHIYLFGGKNNNPAFSIFETRFVSGPEDREIRKKSSNVAIPAYFDVTVHNNETNINSTFHRQQYQFRAFQTNDVLTGRPEEGFYNFSEYYDGVPYLQYYMNNSPEKIEMTGLKVYVTGRITNNEGSYSYDLDGDGVKEKYDAELNPATGLPVKATDYSKYGGFQGDFYLSFIELGTNEYEPWHNGVNLGSVYQMTGIQKTYKYVYSTAGKYTITAVATNVGRKNYDDIDYRKSLGNSLNDYDSRRNMAQISVTIGN